MEGDPGRNIDVRILVQKDGKALRFHKFITQRFGAQKAKKIENECNQLALRLMKVIERKYGSMTEFGLDVGMDTEGNVWLIEANPKPSHDAIMKSKEYDVYLKSIRRPIQYA